jgi:methanogenic corrinoid protein MtbC1
VPGIPVDSTLHSTLERALLAMDCVTFQRIFFDADLGVSPIARIEQLIVPVLEHIGAAWEQGSVSLAQVYMSGRFCEEIVDTLLPAGDPSRTDHPRMAITVLEDYHFLGLRLVYSALRAGGFALLNYGRSDVDELVARVIADDIRLLLISALMLPSALHIRTVRDRFRAIGHPVKIIVGGAPFRFDTQLWQQVGADAVGTSAGEATGIIHRLAKECR